MKNDALRVFITVKTEEVNGKLKIMTENLGNPVASANQVAAMLEGVARALRDAARRG
jgi:hypothetical protein